MSLIGKGFMIWKIRDCEGGNPDQIASVARSAGLSHVLIKIANGILPYNIDQNTGIDLVPSVVQALKAKGIQVWGWHYVYGYNPSGEAQMAVKRTRQLGLDGYVIDAEMEYKLPGRDSAARTFMSELRGGIPNVPVALCSFRFPSYHPQFPWDAFLEKCDFNMPQVYWEKAHNSGDQLRRSVNELMGLPYVRPVYPTGPVYPTSEWAASASEIQDFLITARSLGLNSANFFAWDYGRKNLLPLWNTIAAFNWNGSLPSSNSNVLISYFSALNSHNINNLLSLYQSNAVRVTSFDTVQGMEAIRNWYLYLFNTLPGASFKLTSESSSGSSIFFTWQAVSSTGKIFNENDTFGLLNGKISFHYSSYKPLI